MGALFYAYVVPVLCLALVAWAVVLRRLARGPRRWTLVAAILAACGVFACLRTEGVTGGFSIRSSPGVGEDFGAEAAGSSRRGTGGSGFRCGPQRGPARTGPAFGELIAMAMVSGVRIKTDWRSLAPVELWRAGGGTGLVVHGGEQWAAVHARATGRVRSRSLLRSDHRKPVWTHRDEVASGSRMAAPVRAGRRRSTTGACMRWERTGILNALDAGKARWCGRANAAADHRAKVPVGASRVHRWWWATWSLSRPPAAGRL